MLGELNQDIMGCEIGTNPKYPPINNLDYLTVDTRTYDNYPSDNNPVRIQPKLADLWNHNKNNCGINLIPNQTVQSLGLRSADENMSEAVANFCCETKKAMMMGYTGKELAKYLRARFDKETIEAAKEEMVKLSEEQGLMGNVYIDASAFISAKEAEQFLTMHRNRLAQDIVIEGATVDPNVVAYLANKFHKNVVEKISYDEKLYRKYKAYLVDANKIPVDFVIDSKESLRSAFLSEPVEEVVKKAKAEKSEPLSKEKVAEELVNRGDKNDTAHKLATADITFREVRPIIEFTREQLSKGKTGNNLKEILRGKYASVDLNKAAKYIAVVISSDITSERIDKLVESEKISKKVASALKEIIKTYPLKVEAYKEDKSEKQIGVPGHFHSLNNLRQDSHLSEYHQASVESLRKGKSHEDVKEELLKKLSNDEADKVLLDAVKAFNESPAGTKANAPVIPEKKKLVADIEPPKVLPDKETIIPQTQEFMDFYKGSNELIVDIDGKSANSNLLEIENLDSKSGIDNAF